MIACLKWLPRCLFLIGLVAALTGCPAAGPPKHTVKGRILDNGKPLQLSGGNLPPGDKGVQLQFLALKDGQVVDALQANVDPQNGTFEVPGTDQKGLPAGKYRITFRVGPYGSPDLYKDAFSEAKSPLTCEITGPATVVIDVGKKTVVLE